MAFAEFGSFVSARISKPFAIKYMLLGLTRYAIGGCGQIAVGGRDGSTRMTDDVMYPFSIRIPCEYFNFCRRAVNGKRNCEQPPRNFNWAHSSTFYPFVPCFLPRGKTTIVLGRSVGLHRPCFHAVTGFVIMRTPYAITDPFRSPSRYELYSLHVSQKILNPLHFPTRSDVVERSIIVNKVETRFRTQSSCFLGL